MGYASINQMQSHYGLQSKCIQIVMGMLLYHIILLQPLAMCTWSNELILAQPRPVHQVFFMLNGFNAVSGKRMSD